MVVPYSAVRHLPHLRIFPLGAVPQRNRRPWLIVDYTFSGLNAETLLWAPREAKQFDLRAAACVQQYRSFGPPVWPRNDVENRYR